MTYEERKKLIEQARTNGGLSYVNATQRALNRMTQEQAEDLWNYATDYTLQSNNGKWGVVPGAQKYAVNFNPIALEGTKDAPEGTRFVTQAQLDAINAARKEITDYYATQVNPEKPTIEKYTPKINVDLSSFMPRVGPNQTSPSKTIGSKWDLPERFVSQGRPQETVNFSDPNSIKKLFEAGMPHTVYNYDGQTFHNNIVLKNYAESQRIVEAQDFITHQTDFNELANKFGNLKAGSSFGNTNEVAIHNVINGYKEVGQSSAFYKYKFLDDTQKGVYNYLVAKSKDAAQEYLKDIDGTLEDRKAEAIAENLDEYGFLGDVARGKLLATTNLQQGFTDVAMAGTMLPNGKVDPRMREAAFKTTNAERLSNAILEGEDNTLAKLVFDTISTASHQALPLIAGAISGSAGYTAIMGAQVTAQSMKEAAQSNKPIESGFVYGVMQTGLEVSFERMFGGIAAKVGGGTSNKFVSKMMSKIDDKITNKLLSKTLRYGVSLTETASGEFVQEFSQALIDPMVRNIVYNENNTYSLKTLEDAFYQGVIGFLSGGVMGVPSVKASVTNTQFERIGENSNAKTVLELCEETGFTSSEDYVAVKKAVESGKQVDPLTLGRLSVEATQNVYNPERFTVEYLKAVANLGTVNQIAELMFNGNIEAATILKEKFGGNNQPSVMGTKVTEYNPNAVTLQPETKSTLYQPALRSSPTRAGRLTEYVDPEHTTQQGSGISNLSATNGEKDAVTKSVEKVTGHMELTADQKELRRIGSQFGAKVEFDDLDRYITDKNGKKVLDSPNGRFDPNTNTITLNTSNKVKHDPVEFILKHEMTHSFEINKEAYAIFSNEVLQSDVFKDYVKNQKGFASVDAWSKNIIDRYDKAGHPLGEDGTEKALGAQHEMIADFVGDMLFGGKTKITEDLMNAMSPKARRSFIEWVKDFWAELKRIFAGKPELVTIEQLEKDFLELARKVEKQNAKKNAKAEQSVSNRNQNAAVNEKTTTDEGGGVEYSIVTDSKNRKIVMLDRNIFDGISDLNARSEALEDWIINKFGGQKYNTADFFFVVVNERTAGKMKFWNENMDEVAYKRKLSAAEHIDELIKISKFKSHSNNVKEKHKEFAEKGWNYFDSYLTDGERVYKAEISAAVSKTAQVIYNIGRITDVGKFEENKKNSHSLRGSPNESVTILENEASNRNSINSLPETPQNVKENVEKVNVEIDEKTESASPLSYSLTSWEQSDYVDNRNTAAKELAEALGITQKKAKDYIDSINSIAKVIADDRTRLDYVAAKGRSTFVSNAEYGGSVDCSTLCPKRKILTGTFSAIQKALKNSALTAEEILDIRNRMKEKGLEVSCGLCYVEGSRAQMGKFSKEFIERYKKTNPEYVPDMFDVNTPEGVEQLRIDHPEAYEAYEKFWNNKGVLNEGDSVLFASQQKPKLYQTRTDYKGEILNKFKSEGNVVEKNKNGGLRLQSFSDFEIVHLIDMMQVVMDMSRVGLAGQAYTKVPDFALALGNTGLKINLSLIAKGVDADGNLIFDDVEGMPIDTAMRIRDMYSDNVGTILVVFNDAQLKAALADNRVDFIIPFHRSQWKKALYEKLGLPKGTKDYTYQQNEKYIKPVYYTTRNGTLGKRKATNYMPNEYWDFGKSGKENAEAYLKMCAENNKRPKFYKLLVDNKDGSYSLQPDGSTDGYWKLLIDFKMYNNEGVGVPQQPVKPDFNMVESIRMLEEYKGGHQQFPVDQETVDEFVKDYKAKHKMDDFVENEATEAKAPDNPYSNFSYSLPETDLDAEYLSAVKNGDMETAQRMVDEAAKEAGYIVKAYHGTGSDFNIFSEEKISGRNVWGKGFYFGTSKSIADDYASFRATKGGKYRIVNAALKMDNPFIPHKSTLGTAEEILDTWFSDMWKNSRTLGIGYIQGKLDNSPLDLLQFIAEHNNIEIKDVLQKYGFDSVKDGGELVVFDSNQIKSADPVTYDDNGNVIPLSQRFNAENVDIRYSLPESVDFDSLIDAVSRGEMSAEEAKRLSKSNKLLNPIEIANTPKSEASTTPKLDEPKMQGEGDGESNLHGSLDRSAIITDEVKEKIKADTYIKNYGTTTNKETLAKAMQRLDEGGAKEVYWWEKTLKPDEANAVNVAEGLILLQRYQDAGDTYGAIAVAEKLREIASASGQTVQIFSVIGRFTPEMMVTYSQHELDKAFEIMQEGRTKAWVEANAEKFQLTEEEKQAIYDKTLLASSLEDGSRVKAILLGEITTMLQNKLPPEKGQALRAWMRISLLFNAKTQLRNILGNASMILPYISSDFFGGLIDAAIAKKTGVRTTGFNAKTFGNSLVQGGKKGFVETLDDYKRRIHTKAEELNRFETNAGSGKSFNENHQKLVALNKISKVLNEVDRLNSMFLEMGDRPFFEAWFMNSLENQMRLNKVSEPTLQMVEMAKQEALQRTWQDDNNITKAMSGIKNKLNEVTPGYKHTGYGIGDVVLKFVKTPSNIFKAMIELSPVGFGSAALKIRDMKIAMDKGEFTPAMQKEVARSLSNAITGTAIYLLVYALAASGAIDFSGGGDEDKDVSNFEKYILGIPPYSFKFLGMDVTYTWNQPIGTVLAVVSDIMEDAEDGDINGWDAISTVGTVFTSQSFLSNLYEVFSKDDFLTGVVSAAFSEPSAAIPTLLSQMASVTDPYRRTSYDPSNPIKSAINDIIYRIPFLRTTLPKQVNVLGQEAKNPQFANIYKAFISPSTHYPKADMSVMDVSTEVYALYQATSDKTVMPRVAPNKVTIKGKEVTFSVDEKADFQRRTGELSVEILREMFALPEYDKLTDEEKTEAVSKVYNYVSDKAKSELDIYDYETLSAMEGTRTNGEPVLKRSTYDRMDEKAKQMLVDDYFFSKDERNCKGDPKKLAKLFVKKAKD